MADRLHKLLNIRRIQEQQSMQAMARAKQQTEAAEAQYQALSDMAREYRTQDIRTPPINAEMLRQFREFYGQLAQARRTQADQVSQAHTAEATVHRHLLGHIKQRQGLEDVVTKREQQHRSDLNRKQRKAESSAPRTMV